jgi:sulfur carrier protein ThiS
MRINVKVATVLLKRAAPPLERVDFELEVPDGTDVEGLIGSLGIPGELVGSVTVNNRRSPRDGAVSPGDTVAIIPAISGG